MQRLLHPLRQAAAAFFKHDLALRREGAEVRLVLEQRPKEAARPPSRAELAGRKEKEELTQMRAELAALLNELPETRQTMRHLVFVEHALAKKGLKALHKVPLDVLQHALDQLEGLVVNWTPAGLANLRSKMAVAVIDREHMDPEAESDIYRTSAVLEHVPAAPKFEEPDRSDDDALAAAYAALGTLTSDASLVDSAPVPLAGEGIQMQSDLGARSAKALQRFQNSTLPNEAKSRLHIRELEV
ncbi:MAG: hypothetical protein KGL78_11800 [Burkholderiales bacterium]|nr:hypothetical protein [Burkholderiales bacterium]